MKNELPKEVWETPVKIIAIILLVVVLLAALFPSYATAQSHCDRPRIFVAEMKLDLYSFQQNITPAVSIGAGISGVNGRGSFFDNFSLIAGIKTMKDETLQKSTNDRLLTIPTATVLYRLRMNGDDSRVVHGVAFVTGSNYRSYEYRPYIAPTGRSFATIGGIAGWNNETGYTLGFTVIGFF